MKYLCVDDEQLQLLKLVHSIKEVDQNGQVVEFSNPLEALKYIEKNHDIDVAFLDISLPEISGIEIAKTIKEKDPSTNIVFVTAYSEYALDAHQLHVSGYLTKPISVNDVRSELKNLRHPIPHEQSKGLLRVQCFGQFEVYKNNIPLSFSRSKSKELFAYLVYKQGAVISIDELSDVLFDDDKPSYVRNLISDIQKTLKAAEALPVFIKRFNGASIDASLLDCDYFDYFKNEPYAIRKYNGEFMIQYDWAKFPKRKK